MIKRFQESPILPRILGEQGYVSLQTGKWWMGPYQTGGFTEGMTKGGRHGDEGLDIGRKTLAPLTDFISRSKKAGKPFFVWYAPMMPHDPHTPPERLLAKYRDKSPTPQAAKYHAMVEWFDETIGEIRAHLEKEGLTRDTIIVYVADNGWIPRTDKPLVDFERSKQSPFDGGVRTPIFVSWPGHIKPAVMAEAASAVDIMPTLLKLVGAPVPAGATAAVRTGATGEDVHRATLGVIHAHGFASGMPPADAPDSWCGMTHGTGHGIGLDVHEPPLLDFKGPALVTGDALTIEPGLYGKAHGGIRVEDMVIVGPEGARNLNSLHEGLDWR